MLLVHYEIYFSVVRLSAGLMTPSVPLAAVLSTIAFSNRFYWRLATAPPLHGLVLTNSSTK